MSELKGDFIGFQFDGIHSSELGIIRVSDGSRYSENLLPTVQDKTTPVPGADGTFYFGSYFTQRQFNFSFAYDNLTEEQIRRIKVLFGDKKIHDLIFDELPYKVYKVKSMGTPNLKYICFNAPYAPDFREEESQNRIYTKEELYDFSAKISSGRIYRGEGQMSFVTYVPYANSRYKYIDDYTVNTVQSWGSMYSSRTNDSYYNLYDWVDSSRMVKKNYSLTLETSGSEEVNYVIDDFNFEYQYNNRKMYLSPGNILVYNAGDIDTHFKIFLYFETGEFPGCVLGSNTDEHFGKMTIDEFVLADSDNGICINSKLNLIEGVEYIFDNEDNVVSINPTGTIYNKYIAEGDFFKIKPTTTPILMPMILTDFDSPTTDKWIGSIDYKYYYI